MAVVHDALSEQLISQLLQEDLRLLDAYRQAEKLQLDHVVAVSSQAQGRIPKYSKQSDLKDTPETDADVAFKLYVSEVGIDRDAAYAQEIQNDIAAANTADFQLAQSLNANERKIDYDAQFARRLQAIDDEGQVDIDSIDDAESIFGDWKGSKELNASVYNAPNVKHELKAEAGFGNIVISSQSKGKGRQLSPSASPDNKKPLRYDDTGFSVNMEEDEVMTSLSSIPYPVCNICMEPFSVTHAPYTAALSANSSSKLPFGLRLPCPKEHAYCISCLTIYIQTKLDPDGRGVGKSSAPVFPIRCPECPLVAWPEGIDDDVAQRVLGESGMVEWHHQRLLDSVPRFFCPNPKCSSLLVIDEDNEEPQAACPSCSQTICISCRTRWHTDITCEEYQALPVDERSPEDRAVLDLAKAEQWRRCPNCSVIVEHTFGCNHMTCRCGTHFCFKCGSHSTTDGKCKSDPPCDLWDEDRLLEARERQRNQQVQAAAQQAIQHPVFGGARDVFRVVPAAPAYLPNFQLPVQQAHPFEGRDDLRWMNDPNVLCRMHRFTTEMIQRLTCGYCNQGLNSLADLRYHLAHVRHHPVYACCGRFFRRRVDFERHQEAQLRNFGHHVHTTQHD